MLNYSNYQNRYQYLAQFNDPNSPTYTRRSKTGKMVVVKKGKKRSRLLAAGTAGAAGAATGYGLKKAIPATVNAALNKGILNPNMSAAKKRAINVGAHGALAAGTIGAATLAYKAVRNKRKRR